MSRPTLRKLDPVPHSQVRVQGGFWGPRLETNRRVTLPIEFQQAKQTGRIDAWKLDWTPGQPDQPHHFWDSDVAKWIEAAAYSLATHPDPELEALVDGVVDLIAEAQGDDGYLNIYYTVVAPEKRWTNLRDMHELYCAGHLMEAAVAYFEGTGKRKLLDVLCRYADLIDSLFGPAEGQRRGYPGHEEIELGLVKLYRATGEKRYLELAQFFVDERGQQPHFYDIEARARGEDPGAYAHGKHDYNQSHLPVREQTTAEGHAVRAMYLYAGMADLAAETGDASLLEACERLWRNVTERRMYITGGIGSAHAGERFTYDYDLRNDLAYTETCAAIGLVFWAQRMLQLTGHARYADVMERALYNGVLSGVSLDGERFFYANPLTVDPADFEGRPDLFGRSSVTPQRQEWFGCACCPPNIARVLASLGGYAYSTAESQVYLHLYVNGEVDLRIGDVPVTLVVETDYPWDGQVAVTVRTETPVKFALRYRVPDWCRDVSTKPGRGASTRPDTYEQDGYRSITRTWRDGTTVVIDFEMPVEQVEAHPAVAADCGRIALQRGPLVYCLEEADNFPGLADVMVCHDLPLEPVEDSDLLDSMVVIEGWGLWRDRDWWVDQLYTHHSPSLLLGQFLAIPYFAWANRGLGEMRVWLLEGGRLPTRCPIDISQLFE